MSTTDAVEHEHRCSTPTIECEQCVCACGAVYVHADDYATTGRWEWRRAAPHSTEDTGCEPQAHRRFRIMHGQSIPWSVIAPYEDQAQVNHGQSLDTLHRRGGLTAKEALHVLKRARWWNDAEGKRIQSLSDTDAAQELVEIVSRSTLSQDGGR